MNENNLTENNLSENPSSKVAPSSHNKALLVVEVAAQENATKEKEEKKLFYKKKLKSVQLAFAVVFLFFGFLITAQIRTQENVLNSLETQTTQDLSMIIINLNEKRSDLEKTLDILEKELQSIESKANAGVSLSATLNNQIKQLSILTGEKAVEGSGLTVTITGDSLLFYLDLIDLASDLFNAGAEAVAINDIRIHYNTLIYEGRNNKGDSVITIDGQELYFPIVIKAIGSPDNLEVGLTYPGGRMDFFNTFYNIYPTIKKEDLLQIPASPSKSTQYVNYPVVDASQSATS